MAVATDGENSFQILALHGAIYKKQADRTLVEPLVDVSMDAWEPHISRDGKRLVFQSFKNGSFDLWEIDLDVAKPAPKNVGCIVTLSCDHRSVDGAVGAQANP